jgi:membrane associated rhomboid family serine protease
MNIPRHRSKTKEPILNVEDPSPFFLSLILVLCHLAFVMAPGSYKSFLFTAGALLAQDGVVFLSGRPIGNIPTLVTHTLLHTGWSHVLINAGMILAFGVFTLRSARKSGAFIFGRIRVGALIFLSIFLVGAICGGLAQWLLWTLLSSSGAAIGASSGGAALFASTAWALGGKKRLIAFGLVMFGYDMFVIFAGNMAGGLANPAWAAHMGGYIGGAVMALFWVRPNSTRFGV